MISDRTVDSVHNNAWMRIVLFVSCELPGYPNGGGVWTAMLGLGCCLWSQADSCWWIIRQWFSFLFLLDILSVSGEDRRLSPLNMARGVTTKCNTRPREPERGDSEIPYLLPPCLPRFYSHVVDDCATASNTSLFTSSGKFNNPIRSRNAARKM